MNRFPLARTALSALLAVVAAASISAQKKGAEDKPELYAVVQVDDSYRVIPKDEVDALKKQLKQEHKDAVAAHKAQKAEAKKNKEKFDAPAPKAKKLKVVKPSLEKEAADKLVEELKAKAAGSKKARSREAGRKRPPAKKSK